jgi:hypothetical protein
MRCLLRFAVIVLACITFGSVVSGLPSTQKLNPKPLPPETARTLAKLLIEDLGEIASQLAGAPVQVQADPGQAEGCCRRWSR